MKIQMPRWDDHPDVRSGNQLTLGERAADVLKKCMGTWAALGFIVLSIALFMNFVVDPGHLELNLILSLMAAVQGVVLQISANRGDRIASELAMSTHKNTQAVLSNTLTLLEIGKNQTEILTRLEALEQEVKSE